MTTQVCYFCKLRTAWQEPEEAEFLDFEVAQGSLAVGYDNPIPTRFLAPIDCFKIPANDAGLKVHKYEIILNFFFT